MRFTLFPLLLLFACVTGCGTSGTEKEEVLRVLQVRSQALNGRDLPLYLSVVSPAYRDKGKDFAALAAGVAAGFKGSPVVYQPDRRTVSIHGNRAQVRGAYRLKMSVEGREMLLDGEEDIVLSREAGVWKIIAGL